MPWAVMTLLVSCKNSLVLLRSFVFIHFLAKILPQSSTDVVKADPSLITVKPEPLVYRCRKCRYVVACMGSLSLGKELTVGSFAICIVCGTLDNSVENKCC